MKSRVLLTPLVFPSVYTYDVQYTVVVVNEDDGSSATADEADTDVLADEDALEDEGTADEMVVDDADEPIELDGGADEVVGGREEVVEVGGTADDDDGAIDGQLEKSVSTAIVLAATDQEKRHRVSAE